MVVCSDHFISPGIPQSRDLVGPGLDRELDWDLSISVCVGSLGNITKSFRTSKELHQTVDMERVVILRRESDCCHYES